MSDENWQKNVMDTDLASNEFQAAGPATEKARRWPKFTKVGPPEKCFFKMASKMAAETS